MFKKSNLCAIPRDLDSVTRLGAEEAPEAAGMSRAGRERIWSAVKAFYATGTQPCVTVALRRRGRLVLHRAIGHVSGNEPGAGGEDKVQALPDTPVCLFSGSKAVTALLVHKLADLGLLHLDDRVADYIPEYGQHGKYRTTIRLLLAHRAGIPSVPGAEVDHRIVFRWDEAVRTLCAARPLRHGGDWQAYHAITGGFILGELVRRVSGLSLHQALRQWLAEPLGCRHLSFGLPREHWAEAPPSVFTGPRVPWLVDRFCQRLVGAPFEETVRIANEEAFRGAVIPSGNIYATADEMARLFQMLLDGGEFEGRRLFQPGRVEEVVRPVGGRQFDGILLLPLRFSAGMMLGDSPVGLFGMHSRRAYGHIGLLHVVVWADPERELSCAILCNGKTIAPSSFGRLLQLIGCVGRACGKD
jgi:CubicO group peptidase (beta-lactamase class C family)